MTTRQKKVLFQGTCIIRIHEVTSPYHHEVRGYRVQVAVPNIDGFKPFSDRPTVSFRPKYLILQSSDLENSSVAAEKYEQSTKWLRRKGFTSVLSVEEYLDKIGLTITKE